MADEVFDEADRILIATVDTAIEVGTGRTFDTPSGQTVRVAAIEEKGVRLEIFVGGFPTGEVLNLPKPDRIRELAIARARMEAEARDRAARQ